MFGRHASYSCDCEHRSGPNQACPWYQSGECWWVLSQAGKARHESLRIKRKSASDRAATIDARDDLIITTSALEVGYDDDALMCVIQYGAPSNIASFVQRKGRGGRKVGTRPIVVTVLSPYSSAELFLYRNQHLLTDPTFRKLPLNAQNRYLQRIHGFYTLIDWLAYEAHKRALTFDLEKLDTEAFQFLQDQGKDSDTLLKIKDYLSQGFGLKSEESSRLLGDSDGILLDRFLPLMKNLDKALEKRQFASGRDLLRDKLPENLFSDINLPEVQVDYRPSHSSEQKRLQAESISLALFSMMPGNVTFRGGFGSVWVPPVIPNDGAEIAAMSVEKYYEGKQSDERARTLQLPRRALSVVGIDPDQVRDIPIYRPHEIKPEQFSRDHNTSFWYCNPDTGNLVSHTNWQDAGQHEYQLAHSSSGYPILAVEIRTAQDDIPPDYRLTPKKAAVSCDPLGVHLAHEIILYSDEPENRNMLDVRLMVLGSQYTINFHLQKSDPIEGVVGFTLSEDDEKPCALGYQMDTEGLAFEMAEIALERLKLPASIVAQLRYTAARHAFITSMTVEQGENIFAASYLADVLLTIVDEYCHTDGEPPSSLRTWMHPDNGKFTQQLRHTIREVYRLSKKKADAVQQLAENHHYLENFASIYAEIANNGKLYTDYLADTFKYSITQALKQTAQEIAGVEALAYIGAWTKLRVDYDKRATNRIWLYEIGIGGIGVMRTTHNLLRNDPEHFWTTLAHKMTRCTTAQEEGLLRHVLAQPEAWLAQCDELAMTIRSQRTSGERQRAIEELLAKVRQQLGVIVRQDQIKALLRVFIPEYTETSGDEALINWRLFREINTNFLPACTQRLGREPTFVEARAFLFLDISANLTAGDRQTYPELCRLLELYQTEYGADATDEVRQAFENAVERRLLLTCRCSCPSCLNDRSGQEGTHLGWMLLNRPLLTTWLTQIREDQRLTLSQNDTGQTIEARIGKLFQQGARTIYLRVPGRALADLCAIISYLTDAGIDTVAGMIYPMITDIQTVYPDTTNDEPMLELTIRPIE